MTKSQQLIEHLKNSEFAAQWLQGELSSALFWLGIGVALLVVGLILFAFIIRHEFDDEDNLYGSLCVSATITVFGVLALLVNLYDVIRIKMAPAIYIADKINSLLNN